MENVNSERVGIYANPFFKCCKRYEDDSLTAVLPGEEVEPYSG